MLPVLSLYLLGDWPDTQPGNQLLDHILRVSTAWLLKNKASLFYISFTATVVSLTDIIRAI